mmetsp:Transcript_8815/g.19038  ORF Transcript_8815/g.19038 Transcript_8815/m.19038 type:complete len:104 (+) Transcript_8815:42-353(+)
MCVYAQHNHDVNIPPNYSINNVIESTNESPPKTSPSHIVSAKALSSLFDRLPTPPFLRRFTTTTRSISISMPTTTTAARCFCFGYLFRKNAVRNFVAFNVRVF